MPMQPVTVIIHSVISKQKIPSKEGQRIKRITVSKAVKLSIMITDKKL